MITVSHHVVTGITLPWYIGAGLLAGGLLNRRSVGVVLHISMFPASIRRYDNRSSSCCPDYIQTPRPARK